MENFGNRLDRIETKLITLKWMIGVNIVMNVTIMIKLWN